jgi:hypothetical protein
MYMKSYADLCETFHCADACFNPLLFHFFEVARINISRSLNVISDYVGLVISQVDSILSYAAYV